ncbi:hypothetical protein NHF40_03330 [Maricaulaceae bacterium EIL42A08]|nr:hypothetical protein [Maricaulaceae bacterium EIL42A08]
MAKAVFAGFAYVVVIFALGFALGTVRVLILVPAIGETVAVFLELPVMLAACWVVAGFLTRRFIKPGHGSAGVMMGAVAFALLMIAELVVAVSVFDRSLSEQLAHWLTVAGAAGLSGQIAFAVFPWLHVRGFSS